MLLCQVYRVCRQKRKLHNLIEKYRRQREGYGSISFVDRCDECVQQCCQNCAPFQGVSVGAQAKGLWQRIKVRGTYQHEVAKGLFCFVAMVIFFTFLYGLVVLKWPYDPEDAGILCGVLGAITVYAMAISDTFCSLFLLMLVSMITSGGRTIVVLLALSFTIQGPMLHVQQNLRQTTKTLACIQEQVQKEAVKAKNYARSVLRSKLKPFEAMAQKFRQTCAQVQNILKRMFVGVTILARGVKKLGKWLQNIVSICNTELEKPYDRCRAWFSDLMSKCDDSVKYFPLLWIYCQSFGLFKHFCTFALLLTKLCDWGQSVVDRIQEAIIDRITNQIEGVQQEISQAYAFNFTIKENFTYDLRFKTDIQELYDILADGLANVK
ncbi:unnamed protein product [Soboliphyme baturini]|uniref:DC_STAMP domain-containing protein n=1 Tax=Soboliphyme baturini TaxID=241478 RepID=A0A183IP40_9BILA|nr:unnamed protein product [Soboliphyme baturini]